MYGIKHREESKWMNDINNSFVPRPKSYWASPGASARVGSGVWLDM